eukprot:CAMPEP_0206151796 /NCGR_PEP_ID=MMETSP1473-20131121/39004_1 /ASSEMBLY_ACC=CAM_ASM_001109 /TAXON_ID=1461547 /ORGANISM="Stichococcus sp, Strain RCC1054" /LENGTH=206 /DNA_ID=CAMNT_0053549345 /DNA_START=374 /DNA_END=990 /DNA_ORIENTATION=+
MFGGFDLSAIVEAGTKFKEEVGRDLANWDQSAVAEQNDAAVPTTGPAADDEPAAETSAWDSLTGLGLGNALQAVQETNSSLEQLWGNQVAQLPNLSSYLGGDAEPQSEVAASADADIAPPAEGLTDLPEQPTSPPAAADVPHEGSPDVTAAPLSDLRPQSPRRGRGRGQSRGRGRGRSSHPKGVIRLAGESDIAAGSTAAGSAESG